MQYISLQLTNKTPVICVVDTNYFITNALTKISIEVFYNWIVFEQCIVGICVTFLNDIDSNFFDLRLPYICRDEQTTIWFEGFSAGEQISNQDSDLSLFVDDLGNTFVYASLWDIDPSLYKKYMAI